MTCGGHMVSVLAFNSVDPSSNPAKDYHFYVKLLLKTMKITKKVAAVGQLKNHIVLFQISH